MTTTTQGASAELLPCPFCGGTDAFVERLDYTAAYVQCDSSVGEHCACLARGPIAVQDDDGEEIPGGAGAIKAWNRRATQPAAPVVPDGYVLVPRQTLALIDGAMNHMGDQLNDMDVVEEDDEEKCAPAFDAIRELLAASPQVAPQAEQVAKADAEHDHSEGGHHD